MASVKFCIFIIGLDVLLRGTDAAKILMWPFQGLSHVKTLTNIGEGLKEMGHELHLILPPTLPNIQNFRDDKSFKVIEYKTKYEDFYMMFNGNSDAIEDIIEQMMGKPPLEDFRSDVFGLKECCRNPLEDEELFERIKQEQYDLALIDAFPITRCYYIPMYRLNIPYVSVTTQYEPWLFRTPALPSFVPFALGGPPYTDKMTFLERLYNAYTLVDWIAFPGIPYINDDLVRKYAPEKPYVSLNWLAGRSLLWLFDTDIAIDYPRPTMTNEINIGGLSTRPVKNLPPDLKMFMDSSSDGVIIASFGSGSYLPKKHFGALLGALKDVKLKVILRYTKITNDIPKHIRVMDWIPQNDLLGHPNTKLFITHSGANSQFEALYHGVPMLNFPMYADQPYNAIRADNKGYSKTIDMLNITSYDVLNTINDMLLNSSYRDNIKKGSEIFRSGQMNPKQRAVYWIQHVLKFGGEHMHSHALDMPWYEYIMLDIICLLLFVVFLTILFIFMILRMIFRLIFRHSTNKKVKVN